MRNWMGTKGVNVSMLNVSLHRVLLIAGFGGGLSGEELPLLSLDASAKYLSVAHTRSPELANVCLTLRGRVKGEAFKQACHLFPIAAVTPSGLTPPLWVRQEVEAYAILGITNGCLVIRRDNHREWGIMNLTCSNIFIGRKREER
jgi:hypothetical protein